MKSVYILLLTLIAAIGVNAQTQSYVLKVGDFINLQIDNGVNVDYRCNADSAGIATFDATPDKASVLIFNYNEKKKRLEVELSESGLTMSGIPRVTVYSSALVYAENSSDSLLRVFSPKVVPLKKDKEPKFNAKVIGNGRLAIHNLDVPELSCNVVTGRGTITVSGRCEAASYSLTGTGTIQADNMKAKDVSTRIVGTGTIGCYASDELSVHGIGSGTVYYTGSPATVVMKGLGIKSENLDSPAK